MVTMWLLWLQCVIIIINGYGLHNKNCAWLSQHRPEPLIVVDDDDSGGGSIGAGLVNIHQHH